MSFFTSGGPRARSRNLFAAAACLAWALAAVLGGAPAQAQAPPTYYDSTAGLTGQALADALHEIIDDHVSLGWDCCRRMGLEIADEDPENPDNVLLIYNNVSVPKASWPGWNPEHAWPQSLGTDSGPARSDLHHLFACDMNVNSARNNKYYDYCDSGACEVHPEAPDAPFTSELFEPPDYHKGDVARAVFYMVVRYNGDTPGEPDLTLDNSIPFTGCDCMGILDTLLEWHVLDPVDDHERARNDRIFYNSALQGNRNPFIDHPEWVCLIFGGAACMVDEIPPGAPTGLAAVPGPGRVSLDWDNSPETDIFGYNIYRADASGGPYKKLNDSRASASAFVDQDATPTVPYFYLVTALDVSGNESPAAPEISASSLDSGFEPWINEFHYDNSSADAGEGVEVAGPAGTDLAGWSVVLYNGLNGNTYGGDPVALSGVIPDQQNCYGALWFDIPGIQNGAPDGFALVDDAGVAIEFLSYEGEFMAAEGPAMGLMSTDVGVSEEPAPEIGFSLQRIGLDGTLAGDFSWSGPASASPGNRNAGQTFAGRCGDSAPPTAPLNLSATGANRRVALDWTNSLAPDIDSYNVYRASASGGPYGRVNTNPAPTSDYLDNLVVNGQTYFYRVTAVDANGNESPLSAEASATPEITAGGPPGSPWINEIHYDNSGADADEFVEIAGPAGKNLDGWKLLAYNGDGGVVYKTEELSGAIPDQQGGFGAIAFFIPGIQNGAPDGFALIDPDDLVIEFISYEGNMLALGSSAAGLTSTDIGVAEDPAPEPGLTLQLGGQGRDRPDFAWQAMPVAATPSAPNTNQSFLDAGASDLSGIVVR